MQHVGDKDYLRPIIISPALPNGVTFLTNILLELEVPIYSYYFNLFWRREKGRLFSRPYTQEIFHQMMPSFTAQKRLEGTSQISMEHQHDWPLLNFKDRKVILFVRDGRDGIYSSYKRFHKDISFDDYLKKPIPPFNLPHKLNWGLFHLLWMEFLSLYCEYIVVRFEDIKRNSIAETDKVVSFLNVSRTQEQISNAIDNSSVDKARKVEENISNNKGPSYIRKGKVYEWKESWSTENLKNLPYTFLKVSGILDYEGISDEQRPLVKEEAPFSSNECVRLADCWFSELYPRGFRNTAEGEKLYNTILEFINMEPALRHPGVKSLIDQKSIINSDPDEHNMEYQMRRVLKYYKVRSIRKPLFYLKYTLMNTLRFFHQP